jgi:transcription initiation factor TFIIIB Brf1 subunit/transcription initiation factor TFIIB
VEFRIGKIAAKCSSCGSTQFKRDPDEKSGPQARFYCALCSTGTLYADLIVQIGQEAVRSSKESRSARHKR